MAQIGEIISKEHIERVISLTEVFDKLNIATRQTVEDAKKLDDTFKKAGGGTKELTEKEKELTGAKKEAIRIQKDQQQAVKTLETQRKKGLAQMAKAEAKEREYTATINKEAKSVEQLRKQNIALRKVRDQVDSTTKKGQKSISAYNAQIDRNTKAIKRNADGYTRLKMGIGSYTKSMVRAAGLIGGAFGATFGIMGIARVLQGSTSNLFELEKGLTNVLTLLSAAERKQYKGFLEEGATQLIKKYGFAIEDVNKALFDAVSAGVPVSEVFVFMKEASMLAIGGVTDLGVAVDGMTSIMNAYGLSMDKAEQVSSAFFSAQVYGKTTVQELADNIGQIAPSARKLKVSFQEVLTTMALFTKQGIKIADGTTAIKGVLNALRNPGEKARQMFKDLGIGVGAVAIQELGLFNIIKKVSKAGEENADIVAEMIPNIRALTAIDALGAEALEEFHDILKIVNDDFGEGSSLMQGYEEQTKTLSFQWNRFTSAIKISVVEGLSKFISFMQRNWTAIRNTMKVLGLLTVAIATYKTTVFLAANGTRLWGNAMTWFAAKIKAATLAIRGFNVATKSSGLGIAVTVALTAVTAFLMFGKSAKAAAADVGDLNEELDELGEQGMDVIYEKLLRGAKDAGGGTIEFTGSLERLAQGIKMMSKSQLEGLKTYLEEEYPEAARDAGDATGLLADVLDTETSDMVKALKMVTDELARMKKAGEGAAGDDIISGDSVKELNAEYSALIVKAKEAIDPKVAAGFYAQADAVRTQRIEVEALIAESMGRVKEIRMIALTDTQVILDQEVEDVRLAEQEKAEIIKASEEKTAEEKVAIAQASITALSAMADTYFDIQNMNLSEQSARYARAKAFELSIEGLTTSQKEDINKKYAKKEAELKTRRAKNDKNAAIFRAIINIAQGITAMFTAGPAGIVLAALTAALGAVALGTIIAQPIPTFKGGTGSTPAGPILWGEAGRELYKTKSGQVGLSPGIPSLASPGMGTKIIPNRETEMIMAAAFGGNVRPNNDNDNRNFDRLIRTIQNKRELHIYGGGKKITERNGSYYRNWYNKKILN